MKAPARWLFNRRASAGLSADCPGALCEWLRRLHSGSGLLHQITFGARRNSSVTHSSLLYVLRISMRAEGWAFRIWRVAA